jgi:glyoxylase-like metal-dependent hydrolase (beta-lactamase superfamily II)
VYLAERESAGWIELNQTYWSRMTTAPGSAKRKGLAALEKEVATGMTAEGKAVPADEVVKKRVLVERRKGELQELEGLVVVQPTLTFEGAMTLEVGGRLIEIRDRGRANSPHDVTFYLPKEKVLFVGDILVQAPLPFTGASWPVSWAGVLRDLEAVEVAALVPGHGPVFRDHAYTRQVRTLMEAVTTRVAAAARAGRNLDQAQAEIDLEDVRQQWPAWAAADQQADWREIVKVLVERAWRGVRGQG